MSLRFTHLVTTLLALAACAPASRQEPRQAAPTGRGATLVVENRGDTDMAIFATGTHRERRRIGTVMRATTDRLTIPANVLAWDKAEFLAIPIGGSVASPLACPPIQAGTHLVLVLEQQTVLSSCTRSRSLD